MDWIKTTDRLPEEGKYVLARHNRGTWIDSGDQDNVNCVVVKLKKGLTETDRERMRNGELDNPKERGWCLSEGWRDRSRIESYQSCDVFGNNLVPYNWESFGPDSFFGQTITHWMPIIPMDKNHTP